MYTQGVILAMKGVWDNILTLKVTYNVGSRCRDVCS